MMSFNIWIVWSFSYGRRLIIAPRPHLTVSQASTLLSSKWTLSPNATGKSGKSDEKSVCLLIHSGVVQSGYIFLLALILSGCRFQPAGVSVDAFGVGGAEDLSERDGGGDHADLAREADLARLPDLAIVGFPSHVAFHFLDDSQLDWVPANGTIIDTGQMSLQPPVPGASLINADEVVVMPLRSLTIGAGVNVRVVGTRALVIVAGDSITIAAGGSLDGGAHGATPGPAGALPAMGAAPESAGGDGAVLGRGGTGGGGGGYGRPGAPGGSNNGSGTVGAAGQPYGAPELLRLQGGAGGGRGNSAFGINGTCTTPASGGAGGGALQLTARKRITIDGVVSVGGGGGRGGCDGATSGGGGGGGAGGSLLIEAPTVAGAGLVNAGGGGGGGGGAESSSTGGDGHDGSEAGTPSVGGSGGMNNKLNAGGSGARIGDPAPGTAASRSMLNAAGGGGGGGFGRIYVRSSGADGLATKQPAPTSDTSLPATIP
jgi:hypothetical protein